jgi:hypothetical protein
MFEVGKKYVFTWMEPGGRSTVSSGWRVTRIEMPLVEIQKREETKIMNVGSLTFQSAEIEQSQSDELPVFILEYGRTAT